MFLNKINLCKIIIFFFILGFFLFLCFKRIEFTDLEKNSIDIGKNDNEEILDKEIILEDRMKGNSCLQAIECFYEDNNYQYCFKCVKSHNMYVIVNGIEYKLVYALENGIVTINELEKNGYTFLKQVKK